MVKLLVSWKDGLDHDRREIEFDREFCIQFNHVAD
jgi:hypothetical protein